MITEEIERIYKLAMEAGDYHNSDHADLDKIGHYTEAIREKLDLILLPLNFKKIKIRDRDYQSEVLYDYRNQEGLCLMLDCHPPLLSLSLYKLERNEFVRELDCLLVLRDLESKLEAKK